MTVATLSPLDIEFPLANATETTSSGTSFQTVTVPISTVTTVLVTTYVVTTTIQPTNGAEDSIAGAYTVLTSSISSQITSTATLATTLTTNSTPSVVTSAAANSTCTGQDIFQPIALGAVPSNIVNRGDHPVPKLGIVNTTSPVETNKFYANFFLGTQTSTTFTHPYSVAWSKGTGNAMSYGMSISHIDEDQKVYGPVNPNITGSPASYFINPIGIQSIILSAVELGSSTVLTSDTLLAFSANINLSPSNGSTSTLTFPLTQGMAFVTGVYADLQPAIQSSVFFNTVTAAGSPKPGVFKYRITLDDGTFWLLYATPSDGVAPNLQLSSSTLLEGLPGYNGIIQIAKNPGNASESIYDISAGIYATGATISGCTSGSSGSYTLAWSVAGVSTSSTSSNSSNSSLLARSSSYASNSSLLMFALPHHLQSMDSTTKAQVTSLQLNTTTKGVATAVLANSWTMVEPDLPIGMGYAPWRPDDGSAANFSAAAIDAINAVGAVEVSQNMTEQSDVNSMYYAGKALSKFATLIWTLNATGNSGLAAAGLVNLKAAFAVFVDQQQPYPLVYDTVWGGVVSSASYITGNSGDDFGNTYYNDHHFHYGYHIHAASVIGALDPTWLADNQDYVNTLARDVNNPSLEDTYFPFSRSFDWFHGHSWAKGLFESGDSKDQESTSEDAMFAYGLKMWGQTVGDASMEARGNMMLAISARSFQNYFLMESNNTNQPSQFIGNKVSGILFENKVDHTTYFGTNLEYIEG